MEYAPPNPIPSISGFNSSYFFDKNESLDFDTASKYFLKLTGGTVGYINSSLYQYNGSTINFSAISGVTAGTASASKALIVDANIDIAGIRNITASGTANVGTLKLLGNIDLDSQVNTTVNNNLIITGSASSPTTSNGLGIGFSPIPAVGRIKAYNYVLSQYNNLSINDAIYIKSDLNVGIGNTAPAVKCHITGVCRVSSYLQIGDSTDTSRMISALDNTQGGTASRYMNLGKANSAGNSAEWSFYYVGDNNANNRWNMGLNGVVSMSGTVAGNIGIGLVNPSHKLDISGDINVSGSYKMDGTDTINSASQFVGGGGVSTAGRLVSNAPLGWTITNSDYSNSELRGYCSNGSTSLMNQNNTLFYTGTNNEVFMCHVKASGGRKATCFGGGTLDTYPLSVQGTGGVSVETYAYLNSSQAIGAGNSATGIAIYADGRVLCRGEIDIISDIRTKENIEEFDDAFITDFIDKVIPYKYNYIAEPNKVSYGYIAQQCCKSGFYDVTRLHPNEDMHETIDKDGFKSPEGMQLSINTGDIIPILHRRIQMMLTDIKFQRIDIDALKHFIIEDLNLPDLRKDIKELKKQIHEINSRCLGIKHRKE